MTSAAIYLNPEAYNTGSETLMGRHSAGESFLRGFIRHANTDAFTFWNVGAYPLEQMNGFVGKIQAPDKPVKWLKHNDRPLLETAGVVYVPTPALARQAWWRQPFGAVKYGICGITHTTASHEILDQIGGIAVSPVESWDALICTSRAVRASTEVQLAATRDYLAHRLGATKVNTPILETIPLGINTDEFSQTPEARAQWRSDLDIPEDAVVALYVGRFSVQTKMNPLPMAIALEEAAKQLDAPLYWVLSGWAPDDDYAERFHASIRAVCPNVQCRVVDGRRPEVRFSIWSVADFFLSLSDNVQETYGLTPLEAMAAGLPCVVSDWDGYRESVRHGVDGFRIGAYAPLPGAGWDLAYQYSLGWIDYSAYIGSASQMTAVDIPASIEAIIALASNADLRRRMGRAGQQNARANLDWRAIIPRYEALWTEQNDRRLAEIEQRRVTPHPTLKENPWRTDPFKTFAEYPTEPLRSTTTISPGKGVDWQTAKARLSLWPASYVPRFLPTMDEAQALFEAIAANPGATVQAIVNPYPITRRIAMARAILWLAKYGIVAIHGASPPVETDPKNGHDRPAGR